MEVTNPIQSVIPEVTTPDQFVSAARIAVRMGEAQLPLEFVAAALKLAGESRGVFELMRMWDAEPDQSEREATVADIQELLDDADNAKACRQGPEKGLRIGFSQLDDVVVKVMAAKAKLRAAIEKHGGISAVARLTGIPQPSLSRMLSSGSMPRRATLYKIALALDLDETEVATDFTW